MAMNQHSQLTWITDKPLPKDRPGQYLIRLSERKHGGSFVTTARVFKAAVGHGMLVGDFFAHDILSNECRIVAWCEQPQDWSEPLAPADSNG